jgi:hypothetical protein
VKGKVSGAASTVWVGKHSPHNRDILLTGGKTLPAIQRYSPHRWENTSRKTEIFSRRWENTHHITEIFSSQVGKHFLQYRDILSQAAGKQHNRDILLAGGKRLPSHTTEFSSQESKHSLITEIFSLQKHLQHSRDSPHRWGK